MILFTADTHFSHGQILKYEPSRQFEDYFQMDEYLLSRWNEIIQPEDDIYHLGDVLIGSAARRDYILPQLKGNKYLLEGNHDQYTKTMWNRHGFTLIEGPWFTMDDLPIVYSHYPLESLEGGQALIDQGYFNVHGHVHTNIEHIDQRNHLCISVELTNFGPVSYEWIISEYQRRTA